MTPEEKKERRKVRHQLAKAVKRNHFPVEMKLTHTARQMRAAVRAVTDQLLAGKNPAQAVGV